MILYIDAAHCNLSCKMCPVGDVHGLKKTTTGVMSLDLFKKIADKIV